LADAGPRGRGAAAQDLPRLIPRTQTPNVCLQRTSCLKGSARDPLKHLGLLTLSALPPEAWERRLVDLNIQPLTLADIAWADVVFASAMLVQKESLRRVVELCTAHRKRVVIGGPSVTTGAAHLPPADHLFLGEAETTVPAFVRDLARGEAQRLYQAAERPALAATPMPDFQLADLRRDSAMSVQSSRGCPFQCEFCDIIEIYGRVPRTKSPEQLLAELDALVRIGWRGIVFIVDDNFITASTPSLSPCRWISISTRSGRCSSAW
jgi:radical SAM superfamily enzyme YgiQ (UPF0313 family)